MAEMKMQSFVEAAIENKVSEESKQKVDDGLFGNARIVIVGCGGAGGNTITRLHKLGVKGAETIAINTDKIALDLVDADKKLLIGKNLTRGLGQEDFPNRVNALPENQAGSLRKCCRCGPCLCLRGNGWWNRNRFSPCRRRDCKETRGDCHLYGLHSIQCGTCSIGKG